MIPKDDKRGHGRQLTFDLTLEPRFGVEDFLVSGCNESAYAMIELWPDWPDKVLLLLGPAGAGKSHLGAIWAARAQARIVSGGAIGDTDPRDLVSAGAVLVEDADRIGLNEESLFHVLNLVRERRATLVVTARAHPAAWSLRIQDLLSRLRLAPAVEIGPPDEALVRAVLVKLFDDRQLFIDAGLIDFIALRIDRSLDAARSFVDAIDREALARGRRITRPIVTDVLAQQENG